MGLAASQGRFLCLTARMNDLVYEGHQISQQRMALAEESSRIAKEYNAAISNKKMQCTTPAGGTQQLTYDLITNQDPNTGLCLRIVDTSGRVVLPSDKSYLKVTSKNENDEDIVEVFKTTAEFIEKYMPNLSDEDKAAYSLMSFDDITNLYIEQNPNQTLVFSSIYAQDDSFVNEEDAIMFDENCKDPAYLQEMLSTGQWLLQQIVDPNKQEWGDYLWQGSSMITEVYDTSDDAAAEAAYEAAMIDLNKKDKMLELRLEDIQTQEQSVEKQIDSIKEVIKNNIEDTYKTFA